MSEIGLKDQCFGVEVEFTGITRERAASALAEHFGTIPLQSKETGRCKGNSHCDLESLL